MPDCPWFFEEGCDIYPDLVLKPPLCFVCAKNDLPSEELLCLLSRFGQQNAENFNCQEFCAA